MGLTHSLVLTPDSLVRSSGLRAIICIFIDLIVVVQASQLSLSLSLSLSGFDSSSYVGRLLTYDALLLLLPLIVIPSTFSSLRRDGHTHPPAPQLLK